VKFLESLHEPEKKSRIVTRMSGFPAEHPRGLTKRILLSGSVQ